MSRLARERRKPLGLGGADEREREQDVADPGGLHHLGLAELLAGDPDRAGAELHVRDRGQLVRLDVRPEGETVLVAVALHPRDVALDGVQVDGRNRRVERRDVHVSRLSAPASIRPHGAPASHNPVDGPRRTAGIRVDG